MPGDADATLDRSGDAPAARPSSRFEAERQRHARALADILPDEVELVTWPLARLHVRRDERLRALLRLARKRSPWHARRLADVDPDTVTGDDLSAIPPMTKADLMASWDEIVTDRRLTLDLANAHLARVAADGPAYLLDEYQVVTSGGSSGRRGVFVWDFDGLLRTRASQVRHVRWLERHAGLAPARRHARVLAASGAHLSTVLARTFAAQPAARSLPVTLPLEEIVAELNELEPEAVTAYPSALHRLALEARAGRLRISPLCLHAAAEPLLPEARRTIEETFRAPIIDIYACSESGTMALSYPGTAALHLVEDTAVYEPVDRDGRPAPPGAPAAKLLVTNVVNRVLPLIRYELTDEVTFLDRPSPGPWTGREIAPVPGRLDDAFVYASGVEVHPHVFRSALGRLPAVCEYQVRQRPGGAEIVVRAEGAEGFEPVRRDLIVALTRLGLVAPEVSIVAVDRLERVGAAGKLKRFVPLAATDQGPS